MIKLKIFKDGPGEDDIRVEVFRGPSRLLTSVGRNPSAEVVCNADEKTQSLGTVHTKLGETVTIE